MIELKNLIKDYHLGDNVYHALKGINLTVNEGELIAIMGSSGAGKSTLMNIIGLLDNPSSGLYELDGCDVSTLTDDQRSNIRNLKIGFVFQSFFLLPRLTAIGNAELPLMYRGVRPKERRERAKNALEKVGMAEFMHRKPMELSGGQMQRVAIARALTAAPAVILADEPTGALDSKIGQDVMDLFKQLNEEDKVTTIIVTHDPGVGDQCQRVIHVKDGLVHETKGDNS